MIEYLPGSGNPNARIMIIGPPPDLYEIENKSPLASPRTVLLWELLQSLNISRESVWTTNVFKYFSKGKKIKDICNLKQEEEKLFNEINAINPNVILCVGDLAFQTITGYKDLLSRRGSILKTKFGSKKVIGIIHPGNVTRGRKEDDSFKSYPYIWKVIIHADLKRLIEESKSPTYDVGQRYVKICRSSMDLYKFLERNKHRDRMAMDIESYNCMPAIVGLSFDDQEALVLPLFRKLHNFRISELTDSDMVAVWRRLNDELKRGKIIGQNFKYDQDKMQMLGFQFKPEMPILSDTMIKAHTINPELPSKSMAMLQSLWTRIPYHKDEGKEFRPGKDDIDKWFHYCGLDVMATFAIDREMELDLQEMSDTYKVDLKSYFYDYKMKLHQIYLDMELRGFKMDKAVRDYLKVKYETAHEMIQVKLEASLPGYINTGTKCHPDHLVNVAAPAQIKKLLYEYLDLPARTFKGKTKSDEDTIIAIMNSISDTKKRVYIPILQDILDDRQTRKSLGTYVLAKADYDGRLRCSYKLTGTETGRTSTSILKQPLRPTKSGHAFQTLTKHGEIGKDIRQVYIVDDGYVFVGLDLSQAEPRIVSILSNDERLQEAFKSGKVDIHRRTAALVLDLVPSLDLSEGRVEAADSLPKDGPERFLGKTCRNGGNYDMGKKELAKNIATQAKKSKMDLVVSEWKANRMLDAFHRESPNIRKVFHYEIVEAINNTRTLINPYGKVRQFFGRLEKSTYGEGYAEIPQSTVADHMKHSIIKIYKEMPDFKKMLLGEAHDAILCRFPINEWQDRARACKQIMEQEIDFSQCTLKRGKLKIPADVEVSFTHYGAMEKAKL